MTDQAALRVGLRCDAGAVVGVGHVVRCVALAEELAERGIEPVFLSDLGGVAWAEAQVAQRGFRVVAAAHDPDALAAQARQLGLAAVVLDGYHLDRSCGGALRNAGVRVLAVVDGAFGDQDADLYLDQNIGAEAAVSPYAGRRLAGVQYALLRDAVRSQRPAQPRVHREQAVPRVLAFFGGTDAYGAAPHLVGALLATETPVHVTVIAAGSSALAALATAQTGIGQTVEPIAPTDRLPQLVTDADLVVSAAGTSAWELLALGAATALVPVVDNQEEAYGHAVRRGVVLGLGTLDALATDRAALAAAVGTLRIALQDPDLRTRLARAAWECVDGDGRRRVADALLEGLPGGSV